MYSIQHFNIHSNPFVASLRWVSHVFATSKTIILGFIISFEKALIIARIASSDPNNYNLEKIRRLVFED